MDARIYRFAQSLATPVMPCPVEWELYGTKRWVLDRPALLQVLADAFPEADGEALEDAVRLHHDFAGRRLRRTR